MGCSATRGGLTTHRCTRIGNRQHCDAAAQAAPNQAQCRTEARLQGAR